MSEQTYIGDFAKLKTEAGNTHLALKQPVRDFQLDWRRYNLISNYFAEYCSYLFEQKDRAENLISTVLYELAEAMIQYADRNANIVIKLITLQQAVVFELATVSVPDKREELEQTVKLINQEDLNATYFSLLAPDKPQQLANIHFGLVLIAHDYNAKFALSVNTKNNVINLRVAITKEEIYS
ncbi:MAG: hypothetical protein JW822_00270 [Spirochaetales bacterium]|nr:hypothetical protein [Spirochaetales bacterium]